MVKCQKKNLFWNLYSYNKNAVVFFYFSPYVSIKPFSSSFWEQFPTHSENNGYPITIDRFKEHNNKLSRTLYRFIFFSIISYFSLIGT